MTSRPILFSAPMIRALLAGTKTQTRRGVKFKGTPPSDAEAKRLHPIGFMHETGFDGVRCPYGQPGDELWVRETIKRVPASSPMHDAAVYAADGAETSLDTWPWERGVLPAIHCPRGLSRITLRVTSVRVERLQAISEADAKAEGTEPLGIVLADVDGRSQVQHIDGLHRKGFAVLWESLNGAGSWARNDWVWVVGFEVCR